MQAPPSRVGQGGPPAPGRDSVLSINIPSVVCRQCVCCCSVLSSTRALAGSCVYLAERRGRWVGGFGPFCQACRSSFLLFYFFFFLDLSQCGAFHSVLLSGGAGSEDSFWTWLPDPSLLVAIPTKIEPGSREPQSKVPTLGHGMSHVVQPHLFPAPLGAGRWSDIGFI